MPEDERWLGLLRPSLRYGVIEPGAGGALTRGADYQFYRLVPLQVMRIVTGLGLQGYAQEQVEQAAANLWPCVDRLVTAGADVIVLSGVPVSSQLGRERVLALGEEVRRRTGKPFEATLEAAIGALNALGARQVAIASRFPADINASLTAYLSQAGFEIAGATARDVSLAQAQQLSHEDGLRLSLEVTREAARLAPDADAVFIPGGAAPSLHVIPAIEAEFRKPALTNLSAEVWSALVRPGLIPPVSGWGRLLEMGPSEPSA